MNIGDSDVVVWESDIPSRHSQLTWSSENPQVANVDKHGYVTATGMGKTNLIGNYSLNSYLVPVEVLQTIMYNTFGGYLKFSEPEISSEENFEEIIIYNKPRENTLYEEQLFTVGALPYPSDMWGDGKTRGSLPNYSISWESSNEDVAKVKNGIILPIKEGITTIKAVLHGTELEDSFELTVKKKREIQENLYAVNQTAFDDLDSKQTMEKIISLATDAKEAGYDGILFPRKDYHIRPVSKEPYKIPSDFIMDFNYSNVYMDNWHDYVNGTLADGTPGNRYVLFSFEDAEFSCIRNLNYYGERYNTTHSESEYGEQTLFLYTANGYYCDVYNCNFVGVAGFHIGIGGVVKDDAAVLYEDGHKIKYNNLARGYLKSDDAVDTSVEDHIYTPDHIYIGSTEYKNHMYRVGTSYTARFGSLFNYTRFYNIAFYDSNKELISYEEKRMVYYSYKMPDNAKYFRITLYRPVSVDIPANNDDPRLGTGENSSVAVMLSADPTYSCSIYNCKWENTASGCASGVSDCVGFRFYNNFCNANGKKNAWSYDMEDGWFSMFGCIFHNNSAVNRAAFAGVLNTVIDTGYLNEVYFRALQNNIFISSGSANYMQVDDAVNGISSFQGTLNNTAYGYVCGNVNKVVEEDQNGE